MTIKVVTWTCTWVTEHSTYIDVPEGVDLDDYNLSNALSQLESDSPENGQTREFTRDNIDWEDVGSDEIPEIVNRVETIDLNDYKY